MRIEDSIDIEAPCDWVFIRSQDYSTRTKWDPFLKRAEILGEKNELRVGVRTNCVTRFGLSMVTEYVSFIPGKVAAVKLVSGPFFFKTFAASWNFKPLSDQASKVIFVYTFEVKPLYALGVPLLRLIFAREMHQRLVALKIESEKTFAMKQSV